MPILLMISSILSVQGNKCFADDSVTIVTPMVQPKVDIYKRISPKECLKIDNCWCYHPDALNLIGQQITERKKCLIELENEKSLVQTNLINNASQGQAWWQEPSFIVGGIVVTFTTTALITYLLVKD